MACGLAFCISVFGAAFLTLRFRRSSPRTASWVAVAICAVVGGVLLGIAADKMLHESYGIGGWLIQGLLLAAGMAAPLLSANALMTGRPLPTFLDVLGPPEGRSPQLLTRVLGFTLIVTTADRCRDRARPRVRRALARFPVRRADHGRGAVLRGVIPSLRRNRAHGRLPKPCSPDCSPSLCPGSPSTKGRTTGNRCGPARRISSSASRYGGRARLPLPKRHSTAQRPSLWKSVRHLAVRRWDRRSGGEARELKPRARPLGEQPGPRILRAAMLAFPKTGWGACQRTRQRT